jgi:hypothetical protein
MHAHRPWLFFAILAIAVPSHAASFEFFARHDGSRVPGSRICFTQSVEHEQLLVRSAGSAETRCFPADDVLEIPAGTWSFYVVNGESLVSSHPFQLVVAEGDESRPLDNVNVEMSPAGVLDFTAATAALQEGEFFAIYLSNGGQPESVAALRPVSHDERAVVPAGMTVVPLRIRAGRIVQVGEDIVLRSGETRRIERLRSPGPAMRDVIVPVQLVNKHLAGGTPPVIRLLTNDGKTAASATLRETPLFHDSLVFFRSVPSSATIVELAGDGWRTDTQAVPDGQAALVPPLRASETAQLVFDWSIDAAFADHRPARCDGAAAEETDPPLQLTLRRCTPDQARLIERGSSAQCAVLFTRKLRKQALAGTETVAGLAAGDYLAELRTGGFSTLASVPWNARDDARQPLHLEAQYVSGRVSRNGSPVAAELDFPSGGTMTDPATGQYRALVARPILRKTLVSVTPCDTRLPYIYRTDKPVVAGSIHDIEIPAAGIEVTVTNRDTGAPVRGAAVSIAEDEVEYPAYDVDASATDGDGHTQLIPVLHDVPLKVCAWMREFSAACQGGIRVTGETVAVKLRLIPKESRVRGRVVSRQPLSPGATMWLIRNVIVVAMSGVQDQTFAFDTVPNDATLVLTDPALGLAVLGAPVFDDAGTIVATLPDLAPIAFTVLVADGLRSAASAVTLQIGHVLLPRTILIAHQGNTRNEVDIVPGRPFPVSRVIPTAPVSVVLGFPHESLLSPVVDMFAHPELVATMPVRQVLGPAVDFE